MHLRKRQLVALALALFAITAMALEISAAQAADATVGLGRCAFLEGGHTTVPSGSTIVTRLQSFDVNRGMTQDLLNAQRTTLSFNGGSPVDVSDLYGPPLPVDGGGWLARVLYPTGITLPNPGDSVTVIFVVTAKRNLAQEFNGPLSFSEGGTPGPPDFFHAGDVIATGTCTITAV